jgi:hypothetical protein
MTRTVLALSVVAGLTACAASGPRFADPAGGAAAPPAAEQARLVVIRPGQTPQYAVRDARLMLDRAWVGGVMPEGYRVFDVAPGAHTLVVDMWDAPGRCELAIEARAGATHYFAVAPRVESVLAGAPASMVPAVSPAAGLLSTMVLLGGMAFESAGKPCGGAFAIAAVDGDAVQPQLSELRLSQ